jgi:5-formyltetrahydrofolate cyclo-ligase
LRLRGGQSARRAVGKGGGYSDLEFALLTENKKIAAKTPIVTSVHYLQVIKEEIPMTVHDIPLTAIVTLSEVIEIDARYARPRRIYWDMLPQEKIDDIPVLKERK